MRKIKLYAFCMTLLSVVSDGWSGKPAPFLHQVLLLPLLVLFGFLVVSLLRPGATSSKAAAERGELTSWSPGWLLFFEVWSVLLIVAEARHFRAFGYSLHAPIIGISLALIILAGGWLARKGSAASALGAAVVGFSAGMLVAIRCFPLNYLRSDMLPVIGWADDRLLRHLNPYGTMHVGSRLYDFPYLPGMLVAFLPVEWLHLDLRWATWAYVLGAAGLVFWAGRVERRTQVAGLLGLFLLCPFLQYRHDLYLEPHWFTLVLATVLMQRRRFVWSALIWGISCAIYQLSWVVFPFVILNAYRRRQVSEVLKMLGAACLGFLIVCGPFLRSASERIASNTVGQWGRLPHALADPINLSYWLTFVVRPDHLKWVQAAVLVTIFGFCFLRGRCETLADTLRWMCCALAVFIPLNVIVDGYFYLTLALMLLLFICAANGWWEPGTSPLRSEEEAGAQTRQLLPVR